MNNPIQTKVKTTASENLQEEVKAELQLPDPEKVKASELVQEQEKKDPE